MSIDGFWGPKIVKGLVGRYKCVVLVKIIDSSITNSLDPKHSYVDTGCNIEHSGERSFKLNLTISISNVLEWLGNLFILSPPPLASNKENKELEEVGRSMNGRESTLMASLCEQTEFLAVWGRWGRRRKTKRATAAAAESVTPPARRAAAVAAALLKGNKTSTSSSRVFIFQKSITRPTLSRVWSFKSVARRSWSTLGTPEFEALKLWKGWSGLASPTLRGECW